MAWVLQSDCGNPLKWGSGLLPGRGPVLPRGPGHAWEVHGWGCPWPGEGPSCPLPVAWPAASQDWAEACSHRTALPPPTLMGAAFLSSPSTLEPLSGISYNALDGPVDRRSSHGPYAVQDGLPR